MQHTSTRHGIVVCVNGLQVMHSPKTEIATLQQCWLAAGSAGTWWFVPRVVLCHVMALQKIWATVWFARFFQGIAYFSQWLCALPHQRQTTAARLMFLTETNVCILQLANRSCGKSGGL